jgi:hypothetical protein
VAVTNSKSCPGPAPHYSRSETATRLPNNPESHWLRLDTSLLPGRRLHNLVAAPTLRRMSKPGSTPMTAASSYRRMHSIVPPINGRCQTPTLDRVRLAARDKKRRPLSPLVAPPRPSWLEPRRRTPSAPHALASHGSGHDGSAPAKVRISRVMAASWARFMACKTPPPHVARQ